MTVDELIGLLCPDTLELVIRDIEDSAGTEELIVVRDQFYAALVAIVGEKGLPELAEPYFDHGIIGFRKATAKSNDDKPEETETFVCHFCHKETTGEDLFDEGWIPDYWNGDFAVDGPICPDCSKSRLAFDEYNGDFALIGTQPHESHD